MDYDCVFEANPLLPEVPHRDRLLLHKGVFLFPFQHLYSEKQLIKNDMIFPMLVTAYVVDNNLKVIDRASRRCEKR